jgi:hypothetical protein
MTHSRAVLRHRDGISGGDDKFVRVRGLADNEIAGLLRHAADELDEHTKAKDAAA